LASFSTSAYPARWRTPQRARTRLLPAAHTSGKRLGGVRGTHTIARVTWLRLPARLLRCRSATIAVTRDTFHALRIRAAATPTHLRVTQTRTVPYSDQWLPTTPRRQHKLGGHARCAAPAALTSHFAQSELSPLGLWPGCDRRWLLTALLWPVLTYGIGLRVCCTQELYPRRLFAAGGNERPISGCRQPGYRGLGLSAALRFMDGWPYYATTAHSAMAHTIPYSCRHFPPPSSYLARLLLCHTRIHALYHHSRILHAAPLSNRRTATSRASPDALHLLPFYLLPPRDTKRARATGRCILGVATFRTCAYRLRTRAVAARAATLLRLLHLHTTPTAAAHQFRSRINVSPDVHSRPLYRCLA